MPSPRLLLLWLLWVLLVGLGLACAWAFAYGIVRDQHLGDPEIAIDLSRPGEWQRQSFRSWTGGQYQLALSTVNHAPPFGVPFHGTVEVQLTNPRGERILTRRFEGEAVGHVRPDNMHWTVLDSVTLGATLLRRWLLATRVVAGDSAFAGTHSRITLRKARYDPGLGGIVNYLMIVPAGVFILLSWVAARGVVTAGGPRVPLWVSATLTLAWLVGLVSRFVA